VYPPKGERPLSVRWGDLRRHPRQRDAFPPPRL